jgi:hypothetical protein
MASQPEYHIDTPGFDQHVFTDSSREDLTFPQAVAFAQIRSSVLQSARDAAALRIAAQGANDNNLYQATRTMALYLKDDHGYRVAFDDSNNPAENILLARAQEGYDAHKTTGKWLVSKQDPLIKGALHRAATAGRVIPVPLEHEVRLATVPRDSISAYGASNFVRATIGDDLAERYAAFLTNKGYESGVEWFLTPSDLQQLGVDDQLVEIRHVGVGGDAGIIMNDLYVDDLCTYGGRAHGVRIIRA